MPNRGLRVVSYELLPPFWFFYEPQLTHAKLLLAQNHT